MYRNCSGEISLHKPFVWPSENVSPIWIRQNKFLKCWWDGQGKKKKTWFFSVKLGKTAQPSSKSAGLSWLSRLRRGLCHCLLACGVRFLQRSLKAGLFPNTRNYMRLVVGLIVRIISLKKPRCWCVTVRMNEVPLAKNELCILHNTT